MVARLILNDTYRPHDLVIFGQNQTIDLVEFEAGNHLIRPISPLDYLQVEAYNDPSLAEQLTVGKLTELHEVGYTFEPGAKGAVTYVAQNMDTGEIDGRAYLKTWHSDDFTKPKFRETDTGGLEVITAAELVNGATSLVEPGGWLVKYEQRGQGLAQAMTYATIEFISQMQKSGYSPEAAFVTNIGPLKPQDNPNGIDYGARLKEAIEEKLGTTIQDFDELAGRGEVLDKASFDEVFKDLTLNHAVLHN